MGPSPYAYVMKGDFRNLKDRCVHRTFFEKDLLYFCRGFKACYAKFPSLEALFASNGAIWEGMALFRETMAAANPPAANPAAAKHSALKQSYTKHLADPSSGSACKRLNLALRWLVRKEGPVDLGLWKSISPSSLFIPLDLHVGRAARFLGLLDEKRQANDKKAVIILTEKLRELCPDDPIKYDLALFGLKIPS